MRENCSDIRSDTAQHRHIRIRKERQRKIIGNGFSVLCIRCAATVDGGVSDSFGHWHHMMLVLLALYFVVMYDNFGSLFLLKSPPLSFCLSVSERTNEHSNCPAAKKLSPVS